MTKRVVKHWKRLPSEAVDSASLQTLKNVWMWCLGTWISGGLGSGGLMAGLDFRGLFNINNSLILLQLIVCFYRVDKE